MRDGFAVAAHGVGVAVEDFGFSGVLVGECPVPVGYGSGVAAFVAEELVVDVGVVAVPGEEDALCFLVSGSEGVIEEGEAYGEVDVGRLEDVSCDHVVEATSCPGHLGAGEDMRFLLQTSGGGGVCYALFLR